MKRIKAACLQQTIHFEWKEDGGGGEAAAAVKNEVEGYKAALRRKHVEFKIEEETALPDGSIILKIRKQYNTYDCGDYLQ